MHRTFRLLDYVGLKPGRGGRIPYYFDDDKGVCPSYFNNVRKIGTVYPTADPFQLNSGLPKDDRIPDE